jgi:hypothetical protein
MDYEIINKIYGTNIKKTGKIILNDVFYNLSEIIDHHEDEKGIITSWNYNFHFSALDDFYDYKLYTDYEDILRPKLKKEYIYFEDLLAKYYFGLSDTDRNILDKLFIDEYNNRCDPDDDNDESILDDPIVSFN